MALFHLGPEFHFTHPHRYKVGIAAQGTHTRLEHSGIVSARDITIRSVSLACRNLQRSGQDGSARTKERQLGPECASPRQLATHWRLWSLLREGSILCSTRAICSSTFHPVHVYLNRLSFLRRPAETLNNMSCSGARLVASTLKFFPVVFPSHQKS